MNHFFFRRARLRIADFVGLGGLISGPCPPLIEMMRGKANNREIAYHETGHALTNHFLRAACPLVEMTLRPPLMYRGLGVRAHCVYGRIMEPLDTFAKQEYLKARAVVCMASFPAVQVAFGPALQADGVKADIEQAEQLLRDVYGALSDADVSVHLQIARRRAEDIIFKHEDELHVLAGELLQQKTLSGAQVEGILGPREKAILEPAF